MADDSSNKVPDIGLQTAEHEELLNIIDTLRSQGVSYHVELPQIIVVGDQSSGKSSVLEAISGLRFPTKDILCTRFATELILRRAPGYEGDCHSHCGPGPDQRKKKGTLHIHSAVLYNFRIRGYCPVCREGYGTG